MTKTTQALRQQTKQAHHSGQNGTLISTCKPWLKIANTATLNVIVLADGPLLQTNRRNGDAKG
eukprot:10496917-Lingulodinium_polyedra.AAC.1